MGGIASLFAELWPMMRWQPPVLEMPYPVDMDTHLQGRGLVMIPSTFCWYHPVALADQELPPTIIFPLRPAGIFPGDGTAMSADLSLAHLIGATRARILIATAQGAMTSELARCAAEAGWAGRSAGETWQAGLAG